MYELAIAGLGRLSLAGAVGGKPDDENFLVAGTETLTVGLTLKRLLEVALAEDTRRMQRFDERLLRPRIMPFFAKIRAEISSLSLTLSL